VARVDFMPPHSLGYVLRRALAWWPTPTDISTTSG